MSYLVLARKYRPQSFEDLVGQEHVAKTLANAIAVGRVAHAFLFTGVRGVGKTTSARLLAKCLNCVGPDGTSKGPTASPCQVCNPCKEISLGVDIDAQEIDAASYTGVDDVRRLQEGLNFRPARDRFKIYIVDEVHMLSNAAWNAFLKTLEEPPPHVKFIFATTEVHKVPVTILSRCQRYDFRLISTREIAARLGEVLAKENISADELSVATLAREAAGSMRDAMSLLDQVIAFSGDRLTGDDVSRVLGVPSRRVLYDVGAALVAGDAATCLSKIDGLAAQGFDLAHVTRDMLRHLRNLVVAKVSGEAARPLLDLADEEVKDVLELSAKADADDLMRLYQGFSRGVDDIVQGGQPRMALEMTLVRLARRPPLLPLDELLARLGDLERRLGGGAPGGPRGGSGPGAGTRGTSSVSAPGAHASAPVPPLGSKAAAVPSYAPDVRPAAVPQPSFAATRGALALAPTPDEATPTPPPTSAVTVKRDPPKPEEPEPPLVVFRGILKTLAETKPALASIFEHAAVLELTKDRVLLGFEAHSFAGAQATEPEALEVVTRAVRAHFGAPTHVAIDLSSRDRPASTVAVAEAAARREAIEKARAKAASHPLVVEATRLFGAELREVVLPDELTK